MATLQKFKLLATQCGVVQSPTRSPRTSPVVNFRRPKTTLRMLLTRTTSSRKTTSPTCRDMSIPPFSFIGCLPERKKSGGGGGDNKGLSSRTLKDLFVSSPSLEEDNGEDGEGNEKATNYKSKLSGTVNGLGGEPGSPEPGSSRAGWVGFRHRMLLRKAWRPMLVTIPE